MTMWQPANPPNPRPVFDTAEPALLVVKLADIGDLLTAIPALRALRQGFPSARLDVLTTPGAAAALPRGLVDAVWELPRSLASRAADLPELLRVLRQLHGVGYDAVLFLHHLTLTAGVWKYRLLAAVAGAPIQAGLDNGKGHWLSHPVPDRGFGALHEVEYALQVAARLGAYPVGPQPDFQYGRQDADQAAQWISSLLPGTHRVVIHAGSGGYARARRWEPAKWAELADSLVARFPVSIILVGSPSDDAHQVRALMAEPVLDLSGRTTLSQLAALLSQSDLFLGADSGIMHLAVVAKVPIVALFGPSNHRAWGPWSPNSPSSVVRLDMACSPCSYVGHSVGRRNGCWHRSCLADLEVDQVVEAVQRLGVLA